MSQFPGGTPAAALDGTETVAIGPGTGANSSPQNLFTTTQKIADLASLTSDNESITTISTVGAGVLTAAGLVGGLIFRTGAQAGAAFSDATATAAAIIAALPAGAPVGTAFEIQIKNTTDAQQTVTAGVGVTITGNAIIPKLTTATYLLRKSSATAVTLTFVTAGYLVPLPVTFTASQAITVGTTAQVSGLTGAQISTLILTSSTAQAVNIALPPAAELIAAIPNAQTGFTYQANIRNAFTTTSVATVTGSATGVTLVGLATIAQNATGMFAISIDSPTAYTATRI